MIGLRHGFCYAHTYYMFYGMRILSTCSAFILFAHLVHVLHVCQDRDFGGGVISTVVRYEQFRQEKRLDYLVREFDDKLTLTLLLTV